MPVLITVLTILGTIGLFLFSVVRITGYIAFFATVALGAVMLATLVITTIVSLAISAIVLFITLAFSQQFGFEPLWSLVAGSITFLICWLTFIHQVINEVKTSAVKINRGDRKEIEP